MRARATFGLLAMVIAALAGPAAGSERPPIRAEDLLDGKSLGATGEPPGLVERRDVLALSEEMQVFIKKNVNPMATDVFKLQQLIDSIMATTTFGLEYDENTRTAAETFLLQKGNCLSFSNMFVALAREAGLSVSFQEVDIPPDWSMRRDVFVLNRHVNVGVDLGSAGTHVVDFDISDFKTTYDIHTISEKRAIAHFYNNLGVERMQDGDIVAAFAFFRRSIVVDDGEFSPAWTNLATLYLKEDRPEYAEAGYLRALKADKRDTVAMSNLVSLYLSLGDTEKAARYRKKVDEHRRRNPYYRFRLAQESFYDRDYDSAIVHLRYATRKKKNEDEFFFLLGLCHLMKGEEDQARHWIAKAEEIAATEEQRRRYSTKIETLTSAAEKVD